MTSLDKRVENFAHGKTVFSAFFAEDFIHIAYTQYSMGMKKSFDGWLAMQRDMRPITRVKAHNVAEDDIKSLAREIKSHLKNNLSNFGGICLVAPGPFDTIKRQDENYGKISRFAPSGWKNQNIIKLLKEALSSHTKGLDKRALFLLFNGPGAAAQGHYYATENRDEIDFQLNTPKLRGNYFHIIVDDLVHAALITRGKILHGKSTLNVGHHAVLPIGEDIPPKCPIHPQRPCLNRFVSMATLLERFHVERFEDITPLKIDQDIYYKIVHETAHYVAQMAANVSLTTTPRRIVLGGRIAKLDGFDGYFRKAFGALLRTSEAGILYPGYEDLKNLNTMIEKQIDVDCGVFGGLDLIVDKLNETGPSDNVIYLQFRSKRS